ncbi:MAG TPA: NAD-dependent epimerase/dehydratase family protein [Terriglobales bacterium]|nr:NAD-dependent epimerase/dehydratase family protein [Terriglobales bacterium]
MKTALVTGSGGLIGSQCVARLCAQGWAVTGVDNDLRAWFFGPGGSTAPVVRALSAAWPRYQHVALDLRDRAGVNALLRRLRPQFIIHTAAQPSHDRAAALPLEDFDVNAGATVNLLVAARAHAPEAPFCFTSTNKVYGDRPNALPLAERPSRWDYADGRDGIDETMAVDQCLHSLFGASKLAADLVCQEYGRYFGMPVGIFRGGCLTGPQQAGVELHGYLNYIVRCAVRGEPYAIYGYQGKQVRDQLHAADVAELFLHFYGAPRAGEVYNLGGGRANSLSIVETIAALESRGLRLRHHYHEPPRRGDHICYITDLGKLRAHFPQWRPGYDLARIFDEIIARYQAAGAAA